MRKDPSDKKLAFVVVDMQKKFGIKHDSVEISHDARVKRINEISRLFREHGRPVIFIKFIGGNSGSSYKGDDGDDFFDGIEVEDSDVMFEKHHMNAFKESDFDKVVKDLGCDGILLSGTVTQYCVMSTYYGAFDYDLTPFLAKSATISTREEYNCALEYVAKTLTLSDIRNYLDGKPMEKEDHSHDGV